MNEQISNQTGLLMDIDKVKGEEKLKVMSVLGSILGSDEYNAELSKELDPLFLNSSFNIFMEMSIVLRFIIKINSKCSFYKEINEGRMKYIMWGVLYSYLLNKQSTYLDSINIGEIRLIYCNSWDLIAIIPETIKILKSGCFDCLFNNSKIGI